MALTNPSAGTDRRTNGISNVKDFGATGNGATDDTTAIQAAIAALPANGGALIFPSGTYKITSTLTSTKALRMIGAGSYNSLLSNSTVTAGAITVLQWAGAAGGTLLALNGPTYGTDIEGIGFDGAALAAYCVKADQMQMGRMANCRLANATLASLWLGSTSGGSNNNSQYNLFGNCVFEFSPCGIWLDGTATSNACHNTFLNCQVNHTANPGIYLGSCDNNVFVQTNMFARNGTTGGVVSVKLTNAGTGYPNSGTVSFTGGAGSGATGTYAASGGVIQSVTMASLGSGYTSAPTPVFSGAGASAAGTAYIAQQAVYAAGGELAFSSGSNTFYHLECGGVLVKAGAYLAIYHYDQSNGQASPTVEATGQLFLLQSGLNAVNNLIPNKTAFGGQVIEANNTYYAAYKTDGTTVWNLLAVGGDNHVYMGGVNAVAAALTKLYAGGTQALTLTNGGHVLLTGAGTTSAAAGANAGSTPPSPLLTLCTDAKGDITFGTGTTPAAGAQVVVTFGAAYGAAPSVVVAAKNTATQALGLYVSSVGTGGFTLSTTTAPAASQANTIYSFTYHVLGST